MATIGLRDLYRAPITIGDDGAEEYGTPVKMAKAISAELSVEVAEAILYADDGADEVVKEFVSGELTTFFRLTLPPFLDRSRTTTRWFTAQTQTNRLISQSASARKKRAEPISTFGFTR